MGYPAEVRSQQAVFLCAHYRAPVVIESSVVYPSDLFWEQPQRILQRTCSAEFDCILLDKSACPMRLQQIGKQNLQ